jgi:hypothetical protein
MKIMSRESLLALVRAEPNQHDAIVIYEPGKYEEVVEIVSKCRKVVAIGMDDTTTVKPGSPTKDKVTEALHHGYQIVSCRAGSSRSSAIAYLIEASRTSPEEAVHVWDETKHFPNELILKYGQDILGGEIYEPVSQFYKKVAAFKKWPINLTTKYFKGN